MRRNHDNLWKGLLEKLFVDFLLLLNPEAGSTLDLERGIGFLDKELEQTFNSIANERGLKIVDKLAKVFTREGKEEWVLVHIEVQGKYSDDFGKRMFKYYYRLFDKYDQPVTAYAIFIESNLKERPGFFERGFMGTKLNYQFNTFKIASQNDDLLLASDNPFALAVLIAKSTLLVTNIKDKNQRDKNLLDYKNKLARELVRRKMPKVKIHALINFLKFYVVFENEELNTKFDQEVNSLINKNNKDIGLFEDQILEIRKERAIALVRQRARIAGKEEGKAQGLAQGLAEAKKIEVLKLIEKHGFSNWEAADFADVTIAYVKKLRNSLKSVQ